MLAIFDGPAFFAALDTIRECRAMNWRQVSDETGVPASTLTRLAQGKDPSVDSLAKLKVWMGVSIDKYFRYESKG